jgi:hypothetical protein
MICQFQITLGSAHNAHRPGRECFPESSFACINTCAYNGNYHFAQSTAPGRRVSGWLVTFSTQESGGGAHRDLGVRWVVVPSPAAIDIRPHLPRDMSPRNAFVDMMATTQQIVSQPGEWIYFVKVLGDSLLILSACVSKSRAIVAPSLAGPCLSYVESRRPSMCPEPANRQREPTRSPFDWLAISNADSFQSPQSR